MQMHPDMLKAIEAMKAFGFRPIAELSPEAARAQSEEMARLRKGDSEGDGISTRDRTIPGPAGDIPVRLYRPAGSKPSDVLPALVYFHGGGFVIGSIDTHDSVARAMCNGAHIAVVSVDYRMAPEHKFPAAPEDCYAATRWVHENAASIGVDGSRLAVGGDSAGGNLAAVVALMAREAGGPALKLQVLVYPVIDFAFATPSYQTFADGYGPLTTVGMHWFRNHYFTSQADGEDWRAAPIKATSHAGLPPALFVTAGCDVLLDDSRIYAETLRGAGVPVEQAHFDGMIHGFFSMPATFENTAAAHARAVAALKRAFA